MGNAIKRFLVLLILLTPVAAHAATYDDFDGLTADPCPATHNPLQQVPTSISQTGTTVTVVLPAGDGASWSVGEPVAIAGTGNSTVDYAFNGSTNMAGADLIASCSAPRGSVVCGGDTLYLTSPNNAASPISGLGGAGTTITLWRAYQMQNITTSHGSRYGMCTPEGNWYWAEFISNAAAGPSLGEKLHFSYSGSGTASGGVVTITTGSQNWMTQGMKIVASDPSNCVTTNGTNYSTGTLCLDSNGDIEKVTTGGIANGTIPSWPATNNCSGTQTSTSGTIVFTCQYAGCGLDNYAGTFQLTTTSLAQVTYADASATPSTNYCILTPYLWDQYKYNGGSSSGVACAGAQGQLGRYLQMGFNGIGDDSDAWYFSYQGCSPTTDPQTGHQQYVPGFTPVTTPAYSRYAQDNRDFCASQGLKDPSYAADRTITGLFESDMDWFDPNWTAFLLCDFGPMIQGAGYLSWYSSPFNFGTAIDDTDNMGQTLASWQWQPQDTGNPIGVVPSLWVMYGPSQISISNKSIYTNGAYLPPFLYPDNRVFAKQLSTNAPSGCYWDNVSCPAGASGSPGSCTTPASNPVGAAYGMCTLPDWLRNWYGTIGALNTAWGTSSFYTTFGSSQTPVNNETVPLSATALANSNVTPRSIQIFLSPSGGCNSLPGQVCPMVTGDCQNGALDCPASSPSWTAGQFLAPPACGANTNYMTVGIVCRDTNSNIEEVTIAGKTGSSFSYPSIANCDGAHTSTSGSVTLTCIGPDITGTATYSTGAIALTAGGSGSLLTRQVCLPPTRPAAGTPLRPAPASRTKTAAIAGLPPTARAWLRRRRGRLHTSIPPMRITPSSPIRYRGLIIGPLRSLPAPPAARRIPRYLAPILRGAIPRPTAVLLGDFLVRRPLMPSTAPKSRSLAEPTLPLHRI
jgi:hypothetical protein